MADLRLIGVHEDGTHLVLADPDGIRHRLVLDDALRAAARRDRPRLGQLQIEIDGGLRPRDVQALLRAGASVEETAERAGWTVDKVGKYAGPILAEREHIASVARAVRLRSPRGTSGATLVTRVEERLTARGVDASTATWDSWRREGSEWVVVLAFAAGGRERSASWTYDARSRGLAARDDEARWLSEDEPGQAHADVPVYDVEAEGGLEAPPRRRESSPHDLTAAMRQASGAKQRRAPVRRRGTEPMALPMEDESTGDPGATDHGSAGPAAHGGSDGDNEPQATVVQLDSRREAGRGRPDAPVPVAADEPAEVSEPTEAREDPDTDTGAQSGSDADLPAEESQADVEVEVEAEVGAEGTGEASAPDQTEEPTPDPSQSAPAKLTAAERRSALAQERLKSTWDSFLFGPARGGTTRPEAPDSSAE